MSEELTPTYPIPEDRGLATLSPLGHTEYVEDVVRPGRINVVAAEEGTGKSYLIAGELGIRIARAGGSFAETWPVLETGPVLVLSEMHTDDDYVREETVLAALSLTRSDLVGRYYRLSLMTAAAGQPVLMVEAWREWITAWLAEHQARVMIVDTATVATNVDPWGPEIQAVYRGLRQMIEVYPELAIILVVHLKKPQGRGGDRGLSAVLGEWGRWNDVTMVLENDGASLERVKLTVRKRVRHERRLVLTKRDGLLVDPQSIDAGATKVAAEEVLAAIVATPGITAAALGSALEVSKSTAARYADAIVKAGRATRDTSGQRGAARYWPAETGS